MILFLLCSCINETLRFRRVEISGSISSDDMTSTIYISAHHARYDSELLAHPAAIFAQTQSTPGDFSWTIDIPVTDTFSEGLLIYAWQDTDGDEILCGLNGDEEYADMVYIEDDSLFNVTVDLIPQYACSAPETLYSIIE